MDDLVNRYNSEQDLDDFSLPFDASVPGGSQSVLDVDAHIDGLDLARPRTSRSPGSSEHENRSASISASPEPKKGEEVVKKAGISRSTYFRAKRNLKSHGSVRSAPSGKQIGRPQKLDANAERLIQDELDRNPSAELKQLQALVLHKCSIQVSLSSISRRLKALGCSPSQNNGQPKRARKRSEDTAMIVVGHDNPSVGILHHHPEHQHQQQQPQQQQHPEQDLEEFDSMRQLDNYDDIHRAFGTGIDDELSAYGGSPGMSLDMLEMQNDYSHLTNTMGNSHDNGQMYKYDNYEKDNVLHDYSPGLNQEIYQHADHQRQMLFNDPSLVVSNHSGWQEV